MLEERINKYANWVVMDFWYHIFKEKVHSESNLILKFFYTNNPLLV